MIASVCIPSYNRPEQLRELLGSIDCAPSRIEVLIAEDHAPRRAEVRAMVETFARSSSFDIRYLENEVNLGFDGNLRRLIGEARGQFVIFMGDDDWFQPGMLDSYLDFLTDNDDVGYILRAHYAAHPNGSLESYFYLPRTTRFAPGIETSAWIFKRSVSISGVTFRRSNVVPLATDAFDGTLLYQVYLAAEVCYSEPAVYCDIAFAVARQSFRDDAPNFGNAESERGRYEPGSITQQNSINFTKSFFEVSRAFDKRHGTDLTDRISVDLSKYSYPFLSIQRKRGWIEFWAYSRRLAAETPINSTWHYKFYVFALLFLGERICDKSILQVKRFLGYTPSL